LRRSIRVLVAGTTFALPIAMMSPIAYADAGLKLRPGSFGPGTEGAWKSKQGLPDNKGNARHGLYLQKFTATASVPLGGETRFGTCAGVGVQALQPSATPTTPRFDRISDPQVAADRLVAAWLEDDRAAADKLTTSRSVTERLFSEPPPATQPAVLPCRLVDLGLYLCSYPLAQPTELNVWVKGGASVGYGVSAVEFVD
jgi:hypothetical protein